jgi:hypothetical protein
MTDDAQRSVLAQLELAYERHAVAEQVTLANDPELASEYHDFAMRVLRARMAEEEDPKPKEATIHCLNCAAAYAAGGT